MMRVVYLHGFASSPLSSKAQWFGKRLDMVIPDLAEGDFEHLTISRQLRVVEEAAGDEPVVLIGSSLGGYLAALYAARHASVERLVLMAPAFCFPKRWAETMGVDKIATWKRTGILPVFHYGEGRNRNLSFDLMNDAEGYEAYPDFQQPALIFHGVRDTVVPSCLSEHFAAGHPNAKLHLVDSDHELVDVLDLMWNGMREFLEIECAAGAVLRR
jgi:pimeloyl-ACP methyl ester carboxylesterase